MEHYGEAWQCACGRGAFRAAGREEACLDVTERCGITHAAGGQSKQQGGWSDVMERCGITHAAGGQSKQQGGWRRQGWMSWRGAERCTQGQTLQRGVERCMWQGGDQNRREGGGGDRHHSKVQWHACGREKQERTQERPRAKSRGGHLPKSKSKSPKPQQHACGRRAIRADRCLPPTPPE
jgi:hypothetical protein